MPHALRRVTHTLFTAALIAVIPVATVFDAAFVGQQFSQIQILGVTTGSMVPALNPGDAVIERPVSATGVRVGDVVSLDEGNIDIPVTHRVTKVERLSSGATQFTVKGDANKTADPAPILVQPGTPVFRDWLVIRHGANVLSLTHSMLGALIATAAVLALSVAQKLTARPEQEITETQASSDAETT